MRRLSVFNLITLDGFFAGENGDISWHKVDNEFQELAQEQSDSGKTLLFGRVTYQLMESFWPTAEALRDDPVVARGMNRSAKIVFSRTLARADWSNTRLVRDDPAAEVRRLKQGSGADLTVLGSGSIVSQLAEAKLIDEYHMLLVPVIIGKGRTMFSGIRERISLKLIRTRVFGNGNVLLVYAPES